VRKGDVQIYASLRQAGRAGQAQTYTDYYLAHAGKENFSDFSSDKVVPSSTV